MWDGVAACSPRNPRPARAVLVVGGSPSDETMWPHVLAWKPQSPCHRHHWCSCAAPFTLRIPALAFGGGTGATPRLRATAGLGTGAASPEAKGKVAWA